MNEEMNALRMKVYAKRFPIHSNGCGMAQW
jgi:hypothetical protein